MKETSNHILIIEDSPSLAQNIAIQLEENGYQVTIAETGTDGLKIIGKYPTIDLVLLNVILPDMSGFEVSSRLRQLISSYIPILMLTNERTVIDEKVDCLTFGVDEYLMRPFEPSELQMKITALLHIREIIEMLFKHVPNERQSYLTLRRIALTDHLTGLYNRYYFGEILDREFVQSQRYDLPLSCIMADIDHFRDFNQQYGQVIGDWMLQAISNMIKEYVRQGDVLARYGGEEFVVLLPMTQLDSAVELADRIRALIDERKWKSPVGDLHLTLSFGVAAMPLDMITQSIQLVHYAEKALYMAKNRGRNRIEYYDIE